MENKTEIVTQPVNVNPPEMALQAQSHKPLLMERMATQYGMEPAAFKSVLLKTVFPQDKAVSMEQLAMFAIVAHNYNLNPLLREIYAFPAKGGGIIPVLGYDGWVTIIQRQPDYDGCEYEYVWEDGKVAGKILGVTCIIYRKKHSRPTKKTVWFNEVKRDTDAWKQKPVWMTEIKALIQTARLAYGFGGIYDQDEAERIIEAELKPAEGGGFRTEIQMPQRVQQITAPITTLESTSTPNTFNGNTVTMDSPNNVTYVVTTTTQPEGTTSEVQSEVEHIPIADVEPAEEVKPNPELAGLFKGNNLTTASKVERTVIGPGQAKRIRAIAFSTKNRTEADLDELKNIFKIEDLKDFPIDRFKELEDWANGKDFGA